MAISGALVLSACSQQLVAPEVAGGLSIQDVDVNVASGVVPGLSFDGVSYVDGFEDSLKSELVGKGSESGRPTRVVVDVNAVDLKVGRGGSSASGTYQLVDSQSGRVVFGPQELSAATESTSNAGGGLVGLALSAAFRGAIQQSARANRVEIEKLGKQTGATIKNEVFGFGF